MSTPKWWARVLLIVGSVCMLVGSIDPLEGCFLVLTGIGMVASSARLDKSRYRTLLYWSFALVAVGTIALRVASAFGGIQLPGEPKSAGHSMWWGLFLLPYPIGWLVGLIGVILRWRESRTHPGQPKPTGP